MILVPKARAVQRSMGSLWVFLPLTLLYGLLLVNSYSPDMLSILLPGSLAEGMSAGAHHTHEPGPEGLQQRVL